MIKHFTYIAAIVLVLVGSMVGCKKENDSIVLTGSISGKYSPHGAASSIVAILTSGTGTTTAILDSSSGFSITGLEAGNYKIGFAAIPGFIAPDSVLVTVKAGENFDMGTMVFKTPGTTETGTYFIGKISPANAATQISAKDKFGNEIRFGTIDAVGNFKIAITGTGEYIVSSIAAPGFIAPSGLTVKSTYRQNTDVGTIVFNSAYIQKAIDTITENVGNFLLLAAQENLNFFIARAKMDSAIVITGDLSLSRYITITPELQSALNKIIIIKGGLYIESDYFSSLAFSSLKELRNLNIYWGGNVLKSIDLKALQAVSSGITIYDCFSLTALNTALNNFSGTLTLNNTGFTDLSTFNKAMFTPFILDIQNNTKLTSLHGLNFASDSVYNCTIKNNVLLTSFDGLQGIKRFRHEAVISDNPALQSLTGLENVTVAKQLTITNNPQLNAVCGAKQLINYLKDQSPYQELVPSGQGPSFITVTKQPLVASGNGSYTTRADLVTAVGQCP